MFKVMLSLRSVSIRLRDSHCDIVLRKNQENLSLCHRMAIQHGHCTLNTIKEFYVSIDDPRFSLVIYLNEGQKRYFAGEVTLHIPEWEENVIHTMETKVSQSPDPSSTLKYQFYYFRDEAINDRRAIFMSQQRHAPEYNIIENSNKQLNREKFKLEEEVYNWHKKNEALESGRHNMVTSFNQRESYHKAQMEHCQERINQYSEQLQRQRETKQELMRLAQEHGLVGGLPPELKEQWR